MSRKIIWVIIAVMSIALAGLIALQIYWISFSIDLAENKFDASVQGALSRVAERLENKAEERRERQFRTIQPAHSNEELSIAQLWKEIRKDTLKNFRQKQYQEEIRELEWLFGEQSITDLIDPAMLDNILKIELRNRDINAEYEYTVYSNKLQSFVIANGHYTIPVQGGPVSVAETDTTISTTVAESQYKVSIFPNELGDAGSLHLTFPARTRLLWADTLPIMMLTSLFTLLILGCFSFTIYIIFRQKKLSEMKTDFINNMTHEFKTPIATISLALDSIKSPLIAKHPDKTKRFFQIINQENQRMLRQVEKVLQIAMLDTQEFSLKIEVIDIHEVIMEAVRSIDLQVQKKGGEIITELNASKTLIHGDVTHISNAINNLLDNANKYSPDHPQILVQTTERAEEIEIMVQDKGRGMTPADQKKIFEKFYRVSTGNIHDVKGFGLGLSYVKAIVTAHRGDISVKSAPGVGSTFTITLPYNPPDPH